MPAPPPYGSSSTCPARSGVVSRYENRRRSSSPPRTPASGRCSVSQAKAWGTSVNTSSCRDKGFRLARGVGESCGNHDAAFVEIDLPHAVLDHRQCEARVQLEHVVGDPGGDVDDRPESFAVLLVHAQPDELEDVVLVLAGRRERRAWDLERSAAARTLVEAHDGPASCAPRGYDLRRLSIDEELRAEGKSLGVFARLLHDERPVQPVSLSDPADDDPVRLVHAKRARRSPLPPPVWPTATPPASPCWRCPGRRSPCAAARPRDRAAASTRPAPPRRACRRCRR